MNEDVFHSPGLARAAYVPRRRVKARVVKTVRHRSGLLERVFVRGLDIAISLTALIFLTPAFATIYLLIFMADMKNPIFSQTRMGADGRKFACHKFRTMHPDSEHLLRAYLAANPTEAKIWNDFHKLKSDPRVTWVGRILRKSSLDELPQLFNVLLGEMSLVGPRPIMLNEVEKYGRSLRCYHSVRPGITGLWQVMGRNSLTYRQRVACDRLFVRKQSVLVYLVILVWTIPAVIMQKGSS